MQKNSVFLDIKKQGLYTGNAGGSSADRRAMSAETILSAERSVRKRSGNHMDEN